MASSSKLYCVDGDLRFATEDYICHQTNCISKSGKGLSATLFACFPEANTYRDRKSPSKPGTIDIRGRVINLNAQFRPGKSSTEPRLIFFRKCLDAILEQVPPGSSFAFPYMVGCGLAGGDWSSYLALLTEFAQRHPVKKVTLYRLKSQ